MAPQQRLVKHILHAGHVFDTQPTHFELALDLLPAPVAEWMLYEITVNRICLDEYGKKMTEVLDLWVCDPMAVIADLIGNPEFKDNLTYEPSWTYEEEDGKIVEEFIDDMPSAKWMWELQKLLPKGATIVPIILASDKMQLSTFSGDKVTWPVYLMIGNISKSIRKCPSCRAVTLLGYLPASKLQCFSPSECSLEGYCLFHHTMSIMLELLIKAGREGHKLTCADSGCLVTCSKENHCPELRHIPRPFWAGLPYANIFTCIAPDLLHQLHKGMFKDHLVKWVSTDLEDELDARMMRMPPYQGLCLFKKGISGISQWMGNEYWQMEHVFIGAICCMHPAAPRVLASAHAILNFIFIAHLPAHSTTSLCHLSNTLSTFHLSKEIFVELGIRPHFNIPKLHWLLHYLQSIVNVGACDSLSTDISERLHIDLAKMGYRASNRKAYLEQMVIWLTCHEKLQMQQSYLRWTQATAITPPPSLYPDKLPFASVTALPDEVAAEAPSSDRVQSASTFITVERAVGNTLVEEAGSGDAEADGEPDGADGEVADDLDHLSYKISRTPTLSFHSGYDIIRHFPTPCFETLLQDFLTSESPLLARHPPPQLLPALYPVFWQFSLVLPSHHGRFNTDSLSRIWASPTQKRQDAHYDTVLIRKDLEHGQQTHASIIPITSILRSCHLIPVWGEHVDCHWTSSTVLDVCDDFFLNTFSDHDMYSFIHLNSNTTN
ncbi:hypothetical protein V8D89_005388 [Ganoderma adspersum]